MRGCARGYVGHRSGLCLWGARGYTRGYTRGYAKGYARGCVVLPSLPLFLLLVERIFARPDEEEYKDVVSLFYFSLFLFISLCYFLFSLSLFFFFLSDTAFRDETLYATVALPPRNALNATALWVTRPYTRPYTFLQIPPRSVARTKGRGAVRLRALRSGRGKRPFRTKTSSLTSLLTSSLTSSLRVRAAFVCGAGTLSLTLLLTSSLTLLLGPFYSFFQKYGQAFPTRREALPTRREAFPRRREGIEAGARTFEQERKSKRKTSVRVHRKNSAER